MRLFEEVVDSDGAAVVWTDDPKHTPYRDAVKNLRDSGRIL